MTQTPPPGRREGTLTVNVRPTIEVDAGVGPRAPLDMHASVPDHRCCDVGVVLDAWHN